MTDPIDRDVARRVRERIAHKGVSRASVARSVGLTERQLRRRLHGEARFKMRELVGIAEAIGCPLGALLEGPVTPDDHDWTRRAEAAA